MAVAAKEADEIVAEPKVISKNLLWRSDGPSYRLEATVVATDSGRALNLRGYVGPKNRSFALLYKNTPIRKYTAHDRHRDPVTRLFVREPHKHGWHDEYEDDVAYVPDDIRVGDPNQELMDFLAECNIELRGAYSHLAFFLPEERGSR